MAKKYTYTVVHTVFGDTASKLNEKGTDGYKFVAVINSNAFGCAYLMEKEEEVE